jgi:ATP-dependent DNA helicase RecQ
LISYFGEDVNSWSCKNCDHCSGGNSHDIKREATIDERKVIGVILKTIKDFGGRFGSGRISQVLSGAKRPEIINWGLDRNANFGALKHLKQNNILMYIKSLENSGHLERVGDPKYPCIGLSTFGKETLYNSDEISLNFPEVTIKPPARKRKAKEENILNAENEFENNDLYERLKLLRKEMGAVKRVPLYQILNNATLKELSIKTPVTTDEALTIKGIGPAKIKTIVPKFLEEIKNWQKEVA